MNSDWESSKEENPVLITLKEPVCSCCCCGWCWFFFLFYLKVSLVDLFVNFFHLCIYIAAVFSSFLSQREREGVRMWGYKQSSSNRFSTFWTGFCFVKEILSHTNPNPSKYIPDDIPSQFSFIPVFFLLVEVVSLASRSIKTNSGEMEMAKEVLGPKCYEARSVYIHHRYTADTNHVHCTN